MRRAAASLRARETVSRSIASRRGSSGNPALIQSARTRFNASPSGLPGRIPRAMKSAPEKGRRGSGVSARKRRAARHPRSSAAARLSAQARSRPSPAASRPASKSRPRSVSGLGGLVASMQDRQDAGRALEPGRLGVREPQMRLQALGVFRHDRREGGEPHDPRPNQDRRRSGAGGARVAARRATAARAARTRPSRSPPERHGARRAASGVRSAPVRARDDRGRRARGSTRRVPRRRGVRRHSRRRNGRSGECADNPRRCVSPHRR